MSENTMNRRPVVAADIAAKLGMSLSAVYKYMNPNYTGYGKAETIALVRKTAKEMEYSPNAAKSHLDKKFPEKTCTECGTFYTPTSPTQKYCLACRKKVQCMRVKKCRNRSMYYYNGNFKTREEENARMLELREEGYSNKQIAKKIGRDLHTVIRNIGSQDPELTRQNRTMAAKIRAQKNAARKQYVTNKPIREYNKRVEAHNKMKAELNRLQVELLTEKPVIEQAAKVKVDCPALDLHTVQPTALM